MKYEDKEAWQMVNELTEAFYYLLKASNTIAKEKGACDYFKKTKYPKKVYYPLTHTKEMLILLYRKLNMDWGSTKKRHCRTWIKTS